jgi:hypothetical protein
MTSSVGPSPPERQPNVPLASPLFLNLTLVYLHRLGELFRRELNQDTMGAISRQIRIHCYSNMLETVGTTMVWSHGADRLIYAIGSVVLGHIISAKKGSRVVHLSDGRGDFQRILLLTSLSEWIVKATVSSLLFFGVATRNQPWTAC